MRQPKKPDANTSPLNDEHYDAKSILALFLTETPERKKAREAMEAEVRLVDEARSELVAALKREQQNLGDAARAAMDGAISLVTSAVKNGKAL